MAIPSSTTGGETTGLMAALKTSCEFELVTSRFQSSLASKRFWMPLFLRGEIMLVGQRLSCKFYHIRNPSGENASAKPQNENE